MPRNARLEPESVVATFKNGVLEVTVPKVEPTPSGKVPVKGT
jgi:HSP20 family molecular chaperone IbpA